MPRQLFERSILAALSTTSNAWLKTTTRTSSKSCTARDSCQMASFWAVSKRGSGTREVRSSELTTILVHFSHLTGNHVTSGVASPESVAEI